MVLDYASEKAWRDFIRIPSGDRVKIEVSAYDSTRKRLINRLPNKNSNDNDLGNFFNFNIPFIFYRNTIYDFKI